MADDNENLFLFHPWDHDYVIPNPKYLWSMPYMIFRPFNELGGKGVRPQIFNMLLDFFEVYMRATMNMSASQYARFTSISENGRLIVRKILAVSLVAAPNRGPTYDTLTRIFPTLNRGMIRDHLQKALPNANAETLGMYVPQFWRIWEYAADLTRRVFEPDFPETKRRISVESYMSRMHRRKWLTVLIIIEDTEMHGAPTGISAKIKDVRTKAAAGLYRATSNPTRRRPRSRTRRRSRSRERIAEEMNDVHDRFHQAVRMCDAETVKALAPHVASSSH